MESTSAANNGTSTTGIRPGFASQTVRLEDNTWYCLNFSYGANKGNDENGFPIPGAAVFGAYIKPNKN